MTKTFIDLQLTLLFLYLLYTCMGEGKGDRNRKYLKPALDPASILSKVYDSPSSHLLRAVEGYSLSTPESGNSLSDSNKQSNWQECMKEADGALFCLFFSVLFF